MERCADEAAVENGDHAMDLTGLIMPFGIVTYLLVLFNVLTGRRIIRINLTWHRRMGHVALASATIHLAIVLYYKLFA